MGKLNCPICGKTQGVFIQSGTVFTGKNQYEICFECQRLLNQIKNCEDFDSAKEYRDNLSNRMIKKDMEQDLQEYLMKYIEPTEEMLPKDIDFAIQDKIREKKEQEEAERRKIIEENSKDLEQKQSSFLITTGFNFEGYRITKYLNVVTNEALVGTGFFSEISSEVNDFFGLESLTNKSKLSQSKSIALNRLRDDAILMGANAVIGVDFDIMTFSNNTIVTSVNGTAVVIEKI